MRILYLGDRLSVRGGADLHLRQVMEWAVASGHEVSLAVGRIERGTGPPTGVSVRVIRGLASATSSTARLGGLEESLEEHDLIHAQNIMNPIALQRVIGTGRAVVTVQDHRVFCPARGKTTPDGAQCVRPFVSADCGICLPDEAYRKASIEPTKARRDELQGARLIVLSTYMRTELEVVGLPGAEVVPPWVESDPRPRIGTRHVFLLGGRLVAHKGILQAYEAWKRAGEPLPIEVAGEGPLADSLHGVCLLGWLAHDQLLTCVRTARALLFPAFWQEPFGILGIEALAQGTPVIVMSSGGTGDWSDRGCLVVEPGDVDGMADAIRRLSIDPAFARRLGQEGRVMVAERFNKDRLAPRLQSVYEG